MYSFVYKIYFFLRRMQKRLGNGGKFYELINFIIGYIEAYYNISVVRQWKKYPSSKSGINVRERKRKVIVSLTSFPKRIDTLWITIESLLRQTVKPDDVILWLADSQFEGIDSLPSTLLKLRERGLTIRFCDDLRSHKKYYYTMLEHPEDIVILADDDMFYPLDTIEKLLNMHRKYPEDICSITAEAVKKDAPPSEWRNPFLREKTVHSDLLQAFTGSGSLFPPHSLSEEVFNKDAIKTLCPYADDLWLYYMANKNDTKVSSLHPWRAFPITIYNTSDVSLWQMNGLNGQNDVQWKKINDNYAGKGEK